MTDKLRSEEGLFEYALSAPIERFKMLAESASYHFADDSGKEWDVAYQRKREALEVFDSSNLAEQKKMREIAKTQLWSTDFNRERPDGNKG